MANRARAKSTRSENELAEFFQRWFPEAQRIPGGQGPTDVIGCPWPIEDKATGTPQFLKWTDHYIEKHGDLWVLRWHGDRRSYKHEIITMPRPMLGHLLDLSYGAKAV